MKARRREAVGLLLSGAFFLALSGPAGAALFYLTASGTISGGSPDGLGLNGASFAVEVVFDDTIHTSNALAGFSSYPAQQVQLTLSNASILGNNGTFSPSILGAVEFRSDSSTSNPDTVSYYTSGAFFGLVGEVPGSMANFSVVASFPDNTISTGSDPFVPVFDFPLPEPTTARLVWQAMSEGESDGNGRPGDPVTHYSYFLTESSFSMASSAVPEPSGSLLVVLGAGLMVLRRRR